MANKSILKHSNKERDKQLSYNGVSTKELPESIKDVYSVPYESKRDTLNNNKENILKYSYQNKGILRYTYTDEGDYSKNMKEGYGRDLENLNAYTVSVVKPSFKVNDYEGANDYVSYMDEVYGKKESYFSFISKLSGVKEAAENLFLDIVNDNEGKNFTDYINEVRKIDDFRYAMEQDAVGIVRNVRPVEALSGVITTNVNKFDGKETRLGVLSNYYYGRTLVNAAAFNTARNTKYITEELHKTYGLNAANIYDLRPILSRYVGTNYNDGQYINPFDGAIGDYLKTKITDFRMPSGNGPWILGYSKDTTYFDIVKTDDKWESNSVSQNLRGNEYYSDIDKDFTSENISTFKGNVITRLSSQNIQVKDKPNILSKTDELFKKKEIKTILGAYYGGDDIDKKPSLIQSSVSERFGISHGRNLLTKDAYEKGSTVPKGGYDNPYCRVWTYHNQYSKMTDLVRPFIDDGKFVSVGELQKNWGIFRTKEGVTKLNKHSVINKNGMVNITPTSDADDGIGIKNCMFSLENLAWVGETQFLTVDQKGPNGGRIMWFPPYDIEFSESVNVNWESFDFIGRGEPLFAYKNTKRSGTLSFTLLVDNPLILDYWMLDKRNNPTDEHEQTALRFFAGCETLDPDEDVIRAMDRKGFNGKLELVEGGEFEKDIIFKTFYPHGYYMDDDASNVDASVKQLEEDKQKNAETIGELEGNIKESEETIAQLESNASKKDDYVNIVKDYENIIKHIKYSNEIIITLLRAYHEPVELDGEKITHKPSNKEIKIPTDAWKQVDSKGTLGSRTKNTQDALGLYKGKSTTTVGLIEEQVSGLTTELQTLYEKEQGVGSTIGVSELKKYEEIKPKIKSGKAPNKEFKLGDYIKIGAYEESKKEYEKLIDNINNIENKKRDLKEQQVRLEEAKTKSTELNNPDNKSDKEKVEKIDDLFWYDWYEMCLCPYPDMRKHEGRKYDGSVKIEKVTEIYFKQAKGEVNSTVTTYDFKFRTGEDWTVEVVKNEDGETPSIELSVTGGTVGEGTVTLTFSPNETNKPIEHQIKVISGNNERIFKLVQRSANDAKITFDGNSSSVSVDGADKEYVVKFKATADWAVEVTDKPEGVSVDKNSGTPKDTEIKVTFPENISNEDKLYTILFKVDKKEKEFIIKQVVNDNAGETDEESNVNGPIKFKDNKFSEDIECTETAYQIEFDAPSKWTASIEPTGENVILQPASGRSRDSKVIVAIPENNDVESKKYVITFECEDKKQKFTLTQKENPAVIFEKSKIEVDANPKEDSVTAITCDVEFDAKFEWTASIEPTDATLTPSSGESDSHSVEVTIPKNTENIAKEFTLTVKSKNKEYKSTILQKGANGEASTTPIVFANGSEIALSNTATTCDINFEAISGWTATAPDDVTLTSSSGASGGNKITVSGLKNDSDKDVKSYVIKFKCYEKEQTFTIKQDAKPNIIFEGDKTSVDIESTAATCNIPFTATTDWSVSTTDKDIKLYPTSGTTGVSKVKVSGIPGNKSKEDKQYSITFNYGGSTKTYTINQKIVSNITFTKGNNITLTSTATTCAIVFDAVDNWTASIAPNDKGVKLSTTKGKEGAGQSLEITGLSNTTANKIEYTVTFTCKRKTYDCKIIHLPKSEVKFKDNKTEDRIQNDENEYTIEFTASTAWSASTDSEGVTLTPSSGTSGITQSIKVSVVKNDSNEQKFYIITIICEDKVEHKFTIKQFDKESNETTKTGTYNMRSVPSTIENGGTTEGDGNASTGGGETTGGGATEGDGTTGGGTTEGGGNTNNGGTTEGDGNDEDNNENIGNTTGVWKFKGFLNEKQKDSVEYDNLITLKKFMDGAYEDFPKYATESLKKDEKKDEKEGKDDHVPDIEDEIKILAGEGYRLPNEENDDNLGNNETNDETNDNEYKAPDLGNFGDGSTLGEIVNSLKKLHKEIWDIKENIKKSDKNDEKKQLRGELKTKQSEYNSLHDEYKGYITVLKSKVKQKETLEKESEKLSEKISEDEMFLEKIEDIFVGLTEQFGHTKPIYFYKYLPSRSKIAELKVQISFIEDAINRTPNEPNWNENLGDLVKELESLKEELNDLQENSKGWGLVEASDAKEAYINYSLQSAFKTYGNYQDAENKYFYEFDEKKICSVVDNSSVKYYKIDSVEINNQLPYVNVSSKSALKKLGTDIGFLTQNKKYLVKNNNDNSILEFVYEEDVIKYMSQNKHYKTKKEFLDSKDSVAILGDKFIKKVLTEIPEEEAFEKFRETLADKTPEDIDKEFFSDKQFNTLKELKESKKKGDFSFGKIQYYFVAQMDYPVYECIEDFIIDCKLKIDYIRDIDAFDEQFGYIKVPKEKMEESQQPTSKIGEESDIPSSNGTTSNSSENEKEEYEYRLYRARLEYKSNANDGEEEPKEGEGATEGEEGIKTNNVKYPSEVFDIKNKNHLDLESFGLNTTYELVKKYTGDNDLTCSHAEFFAALCSDEKNPKTDKSKYEIYKNRVLKCEEFTLKKNGYEDAEVERLVGEAEKRIEMIKYQLTSKEMQGDMNYKIRKVILNSAIGADEEKMGIDKRNEKFKEWLSGNIAALKDKTYETNSKGETESQVEGETESQDESGMTKYMDSYSALEDKKSRNTKVQILFGDFDESKNEEYDPGVIPIEHDVHYGNEQLFFSLLKEQDNVAYQRLVDKVRYFSPAFHSMSPEGFNARLTFLHQCTRQGPSRTISDGINDANNLAFGRPPICILKLGNFLNTRIIINSMSISYPDSLWDINPEGIGMQFMMAKVQLGIDILGGSDIDGPIRQLQNAISFNYYANTSLYDSGSNANISNVIDKNNE